MLWFQETLTDPLGGKGIDMPRPTENMSCHTHAFLIQDVVGRFHIQ